MGYSEAKEYVRLITLLIKQKCFFSDKPCLIENIKNNSFLLMPKKKLSALVSEIKHKQLSKKIKLIVFFDSLENDDCVLAYKDLWTDEQLDNLIHQRVQSQLLVSPDSCEYLYWYEKILRQEKMSHIKSLSENYIYIFCFSYQQISMFKALYEELYKKDLVSLVMIGSRLFNSCLGKTESGIIKKNISWKLLLNINYKIYKKCKPYLLKISQKIMCYFFVKKQGKILIVLSSKNVKYYRAAMNIAKSFQDKKINVMIMTTDFRTAIKFRCLGYQTLPFCLSGGHFLNESLAGDRLYTHCYEQLTVYINCLPFVSKLEQVILLPHWSYLGYAMMAIAKKRCLKTHSMPLVSVAPRASSIIGWECIDYIYCYGEQCQSAFKALGHKNVLINIGNILYNKESLCTNREESAILIATSRIDKNENDWIDSVLQYCEKNNRPCYIAVHPSFSPDLYKPVIKPYKSLVKILQVSDMISLLKKSVLCVTDCSSVGSEAVFLNKYLMTMNLTNKPFAANRYSDYKVSLEVNHIEAVWLSLDKILLDVNTQNKLKSNYAEFYNHYNLKNDGLASERLAEYISAL